MSLLVSPLCAVLAWTAYRLCVHHPRRWRSRAFAAAAILCGVIAACGLVSTTASAAVAVFTVLTWLMFWLAVIPLLSTWRRHRTSAHGA